MEQEKGHGGRAGARAPAASGLDGVVVAETRLSDVDGERGRLIIAGRDVEALAGRVPFEEACALLWHAAKESSEAREASSVGQGPSASDTAAVRAAIADARVRAWERVPTIGDALSAADGMDALRAAAAHLIAPLPSSSKSSFASLDSSASLEYEAPMLVGAIGVFAAAFVRVREGKAPIPPDPSRPHAADVLRMARGDDVPDALAAGLDAYLVTVIDHGMNASTFAARVVTSTGSDTVSAVVAAIGALKGPLHGGAPGPVLDMLSAVGSPERAAAWIEGELAAGRRIMGMGHRIYRVRDPRAAVLERAIVRLTQAGVGTGRLALARAVERAAEGVLRARYPDRPLRANVEFYTAVLLDALGLPRQLFSPMFAAGRVAGWCAHIAEQRAAGRLIRPASLYIGPVPPEHEESGA